MDFDFSLEKRLELESPDLHRVVTGNIAVCSRLLEKICLNFPVYTDHSILHSMEVLDFCNRLIGENVQALNADEIFVLIMSAYLHDSGMSVSKKDFYEFCPQSEELRTYTAAHPEEPEIEIIRKFHHELSGLFIRKYAGLFDFPSPQHLFAVVQVSRGHRKRDLFDEAEYPAVLPLENGNVIRLPYLAAAVRMADEIDIAADRNSLLLFDFIWQDNGGGLPVTDQSRMEFRKHQAVRRVEFAEDRFIAHVHYPDPSEPWAAALEDGLEDLFFKVRDTIATCCAVTQARTPFRLRQTSLEIIRE